MPSLSSRASLQSGLAQFLARSLGPASNGSSQSFVTFSSLIGVFLPSGFRIVIQNSCRAYGVGYSLRYTLNFGILRHTTRRRTASPSAPTKRPRFGSVTEPPPTPSMNGLTPYAHCSLTSSSPRQATKSTSHKLMYGMDLRLPGSSYTTLSLAAATSPLATMPNNASNTLPW